MVLYNKPIIYTGERDRHLQIRMDGNYIYVSATPTPPTGSLVAVSYTPAIGKTFSFLNAVVDISAGTLNSSLVIRNNGTTVDFMTSQNLSNVLIPSMDNDFMLGNGTITYDIFASATVSGNAWLAILRGYVI